MHRQCSGRAAVLAVVGSLAVVAGSEAQTGRVVAVKIVVEDCEEMGACEWRLACKAGAGAEVELVPNASGGYLTEVEINQKIPVKAFPVKLTCRLWEDDGWFGVKWQDAGSATLELPAGGEYAVEVGKAGQGRVKVHFNADSLQVAAPPAPAPAAEGRSRRPAKPAPPPKYAAVFQREPEGRAVIVGLPWDTFKARAEALDKHGIKLDNFHTQRHGDAWLWSGIFHGGTAQQVLVAGLDWEAFQKKWTELYDQKKRMLDLETYDDGKKRLFAGVFRDGSDSSTIWSDPRDTFRKKWQEFSGQGLRLVDLEVFRSGAKMFYAGTFRAGEGGYGLHGPLAKEAFLERLKSAAESGQRVVDLEVYEEDGKRLYDAVMRSGGGSDNRVELELDAAALTAKWNEMLDKGFRLTDLKTY